MDLQASERSSYKNPVRRLVAPGPGLDLSPRKIKICLACSHGGHLTEMLELAEAFHGHDTFYFCYEADTTRILPNVYLVPNMARNPVEFIKNLFRVWRIFRRERPDLVVSTGIKGTQYLIFLTRASGARFAFP